MNAIHLSHEAQLHREAYIATLNGLLDTPASKREFAKRVGISAQYLSYLLNPYDRTPSPAVAERMVAALPLAQAEQHHLLEHLLLASERRLQAEQRMQQEFSGKDLNAEWDSLQQMEQAINFAHNPHQVRVQQQTLRHAGKILLAQLSPTGQPLQRAQLCLWLNNVENVLNLPANALYYAKKARMILCGLERAEVSAQHRVRYDALAFNALRCESVAYHNLKLSRPAYQLCCAAETTDAAKAQAKTYLPHLYRDKINAYRGLPRFSIREVETWAKEGTLRCEQNDHQEAELWAFMLNRSLADAYLHFGAHKKAERVLTWLADQLEQLPLVGTMHRVCFLRSYAQLFWLKGDLEAWETIVYEAVQLATTAGLLHQISLLEQAYGKSLQPISSRLSP